MTARQPAAVFYVPPMLFCRQPASAMGTQTPVTSTSTCGRHPGIAAVVSATTVNTTPRVSTVSAVSRVSTATSGGPSLPLMLVKVRFLVVPKAACANIPYHSSLCWPEEERLWDPQIRHSERSANFLSIHAKNFQPVWSKQPNIHEGKSPVLLLIKKCPLSHKRTSKTDEEGRDMNREYTRSRNMLME